MIGPIATPEVVQIEAWHAVVLVGAVALVSVIALLLKRAHRRAKSRQYWFEGGGMVTPGKITPKALREFRKIMTGPDNAGRPPILDVFGALGSFPYAKGGVIRELPPMTLNPVPSELVVVMGGDEFFRVPQPGGATRTDSDRCANCAVRSGDCCTHFTPPLNLKTIEPQLCVHWRSKTAVTKIIEIRG